MGARSFAEQEAELLTELTDLFAHRAKEDQRLSALLAEGVAASRGRHRAAAEEAQRVFEVALQEAQAEHAAARERTGALGAAKLEAATKAMKAELAAFREQTRALAGGVAKKLEESKWLAETLYESGERRARTAYETAKAAISQHKAELERIEQGVRTALEDRGLVLAPPGPTDGQCPVEGGGAAGSATLESAAQSARDCAYRLERCLRPFLCRPLGVLAVLIAGVVVGAAIGGGSSWLGPTLPRTAVLAGAGTGAAAGFVVILAVRFWGRRRAPARARALWEALDLARHTASLALRSAAAAKDADTAGVEGTAYREWATARTSVAQTRSQVQTRNTQETELRADHQKKLDLICAERDRSLADIDKHLAERRAALEANLAAATGQSNAALAESERRIAEEDREGRRALREDWSRRIATATKSADELAGTGAAISPGWDSPLWQSLTPASATPPGVRFGQLRLDLAALPGGLPADPALTVPGSTTRDLPLMIDLLGRGSVLLRATPDTRAGAIAVMNNIILRLLTGLPPGKVRFTIADPVGLGQSFAGLMHLSDYEAAIVGERIWTDPRHIEQRLTDLTEHMETVIQKYLRNEYESIQAYNAEADEVAEPCRFLVIADFPASITESAAKRLASIATSGARCGVFLLLMTTQPAARPDTQKRPASSPAGPIPWSEIERNSMVLRVAPTGSRWTQEPFSAWPIDLEPPPDEAASTRLLHQIGEHAKDSTRVQVPFEIVEPPEGRLWTADATSELRLPLGRSGAKKLQYLSLGRGTAQHALIAGRTGSGKSTLLHVIVTSAALWYSPDQVELYLVDFKKGVEFKTYATHRLPHARVVAVESEREFGLSVLHRLDAELTRRGELFRRAGAQDLPAFRRWQAQNSDGAPGAALPRILLVVDEFQEFFVEDDKLAQDAALLLDRLVRQGRAFGMHVVLGSQTLGGAYTLARSTLGQMAVRIALQCSEADSYLIMSEDNLAPRLLSRPGEAVYNDASGLVEANSPFQVVWLPDETRDSRLERVGEHFAASGRPPPPQIVFEGNVPGDPARTHPINGLIARTTPRRPAATLWLGEPLAIKEPTGIVLQHRSAANILVVGNQDEQGAAITASAILSLGAWLRTGDNGDRAEGGQIAAITVLDGAPPDLPHTDLLPGLVRGLGPLARLVAPRSAKDALSEVTTEIDRREASGLTAHPPALVVIQGLQRFRDLRRPSDFSFSSEPAGSPSGSDLLMKLLRSGPPVGVHTLLWCDTATNLERMLERSALRDFNSRVIMQMSAGDSTQLIDTQQGATLGRHRALLYSDDTGTIEKFRPYALPSPGWVAKVLGRLGEPTPAP